jgi:hypothetical protein
MMTSLPLGERLARLDTLSPADLRTEWLQVLREPAPPLPADLLRRGLAHHHQERAHGRLPTATRRRIERLVQQLAASGEIATERDVVVKVGTRLARDWHGRTHHVLVLDDGYLYENRRYTSLSRIAAEITGATWSGPRFFGLKRRPKPFATPEAARG